MRRHESAPMTFGIIVFTYLLFSNIFKKLGDVLMKSNARNITKRLISVVLVLIMTMSMLTIGIPISSASRDIADLAADLDVSGVGVDPLTVTIDTGASVTLYDNDDDGYYDIGTADDLYAFSALVFSGKTTINGELTANIIVNEGKMTEESTDARAWLGIGRSGSNIYNGDFEGNNFSISGLYHNDTSSSFKGLFGRTGANFSLQNLTLKNSYIQGDDSVGAIVGYSYGTITNCHSIDNTVVGSNSDALYIGGVVGYAYTLTITGCTNTSSVLGHSYVGGIVGFHSNSSVMTDCHNSGYVKGMTTDCGGVVGNIQNAASIVTNCTNSGTVEGVTNTGGVAGKSVGQVLESKNSGNVTATGQYCAGVVGHNTRVITDCSNSGVVTGKGYVAGVAGYNNGSAGDILRCYNTGTINGTGAYVGGIAGSNYNATTIISCYNTGAVTGTGNYVGGISGNNASTSAIIRNCFSTGTVTGGASYVGGITGQNGTTLTDCYYLDTAAAGGINGADSAGKAEARTADQFASGEVAYTLQGTQTDEIWGQTIGEDLLPQLNGDKVYEKGANCVDDPIKIYSNSPDVSDHTVENGFCSYCGLTEPAVDSDGDGYYEIDNAGKLYWFANQVDAGNTKYNAILTADITVNEGTITADSTDARVWNPIGTTTSVVYAGNFNGNGKTISGLYYSGTGTYIGLFANISSAAVVSDVHLTNSYFSGGAYTAGIAGYNSGTITGCSSAATIEGTANYVGGITGYSNNDVLECYNTGDISSTGSYAGGVVGYNTTAAGLVNNCYNAGTVYANNYSGGVVGYNYNASDIKNCYNAGVVTKGTGSYTGAITGRNYNNSPTYVNCYYLEGTSNTDCTNATSSKAVVVTAEQLASGEVAYLLQGSQTDEFWGQTLGEDLIPQLNGDKVYLKGVGCAGDPVQVYSNDPSTPDHNYINGFCSVCDGYEPALDTDGDWYYEIDNAGKLYWFAAQVNSGNTEISAKLTKDIVINQGDITAESTDARQWTAIGNDDTPFKGHFNGNNKTISGMYHNSTDTNVGLIGNLNAGAYISDVHITNSYIKAKSNSAFIAGDNYATISGCTVTDSVITGTGNYIGGIAGYSSTAGCIVECFNESTVAGGAYVGGIAGDNHGGAGIYNCYNTGDVSSSGGYCGGITGYNTGSGSNVMNCYTTGAVTGSTSYDGAVVGRNNEGTVTNCYFLTGAHAGGINGSNTAGKAEVKTAEQFASGAVTHLLQGTQEGNIWGQTLGEDAFPALHDDTVYLKGVGCPDDPNQIYSNTPDTPPHNYVNGFCTVCDGYEPALDTDEDGYYEIDNGGKLYWFASQINGGNNAINAILTKDIFVNEGTITADSTDARELLPIGNNTTQFMGTFDGANHTVSGLYHSSAVAYVGLVGVVGADGVVTRVNVANSYISGTQYIGAVAGYTYGTVSYCSNSGTVVGTTNSVGGVTGYINTGHVFECYNTGSVNAPTYVGGVVGYINNAGSLMENCYNTGDVTGTSYTGGVCGRLNNAGEFKNCYNTGKVTCSGDYKGGVLGRNQNSGVYTNNCYLEGTATGGYNGNDTEGKAEVRTAEAFASGEVAYLLQGSQETEVWGQKIGEDTLPLLHAPKVYYSDVDCADDAPIGYTNYATKPDHTWVATVTPPTDRSYGYTTHVCSVCNKTYVDSYVRPHNVSGDFFIFDNVDSEEPFVHANKDAYVIDEPIYVTAGNGVWVGLYTSNVTNPTSLEYAVYTYHLDGSDTQIFDIKTGIYNSENAGSVPPYLDNQTYNLFLFTDDGFTVGAQSTIKVDYGNIDLYDNLTYVATNRSTYTYGEEITLNALAPNHANAWVGVYPKGSDTATTPAEYIIKVADFPGINVNLIANSKVTPGRFLKPGEYDVRLFSEQNVITAEMLAEVSITVSEGFVTTDKDSYGYGENITAHAEACDSTALDIQNTLVTKGNVNLRVSPDSDATSLAVVPKGETVNLIGLSGGDSANWAYVEYNGDKGYMSPYFSVADGSDVKMYGYLVNSTSELYNSNSTDSGKLITNIPAGTAYNYLEYIGPYWIKVQLGGYTGYLYRNTVTATSYYSIVYEPYDVDTITSADSDARVDLYKNNVTPGADVTADGSYNLNNTSSTVVLQNVSTVTTPIASGEHKLYLYGTEGYENVLDTATFSVSNEITGTFSRGAYYVEKLSDGFANGTVMLELSEDSYGYIGSGAYAAVYWVDAEGNPLEDFGSFAKLPITNNILSFDMAPYSIIPEGAKGLKAYVGYNDVDSTTGLYIPLPEGCKTYDGLDDATYDEFQVLADSKVGNETNTYYDEHYVAALEDIADLSGANSLGIFIAGDSTNDGKAEQFESLNTYRDSVAASTNKTVPPVYVAHGNTDDRNGMDEYVAFVGGYAEGVTEDKPYYSMMIGGYKFIFLVIDIDDEQISVPQLEWLDAELLDNEENNDGKPVFVLCHKALGGSNLPGTQTVTNMDEVSAVFSKYDDVIVWSGNTLAALNSTGNICGGSVDLPVNVNVGAVSRTRRYVNGVNQGYIDDSADGIYVRVYEDKIVLMGRDFISGKWIPEAYCVLYNNDVSLPEKFPLIHGFTASAEDFLTSELGRPATFTSSEPTIAIIDSTTGLVNTVDYGHTIITAFADATNTEVVTRANMDLRVKKPYDPGDPSDTNLLGIDGDFETGINMLHAEDPDFVSHTVTLYRGTYEFILKNVEYDFLQGKDITIVDKTDSNGFTVVEESDERFTLEASGGVYTFTFDEDTLVLTIDADLFEPEQESTFELMGLYNTLDEGITMLHTDDTDIVRTTIELYKGEYNFNIRNNGEDIIGSNTIIKDSVTGHIMNSEDVCTLLASGGTYTFDYCLSKNELSVSFEPANIEETGEKTATIYVDFKDSDFTSTPYIYIWDETIDSVLNNIGPLKPGQILDGPNSEGFYYRTFKYDTSYQFVISDGENLKTADSIVYDQEEVYVYFTEGTDYETEKAPW
ncbi:MAG: hypothetical protein E7566_04255, partial [Ruminococcaceae bacterium]|nr:hypothetical protein [Oscillospiraceae bacterium]